MVNDDIYTLFSNHFRKHSFFSCGIHPTALHHTAHPTPLHPTTSHPTPPHCTHFHLIRCAGGDSYTQQTCWCSPTGRCPSQVVAPVSMPQLSHSAAWRDNHCRSRWRRKGRNQRKKNCRGRRQTRLGATKADSIRGCHEAGSTDREFTNRTLSK